VEDGPTLTHGEMNYGAGIIAARRYGAKTVEPRKHAVGSLKKIYTKYPKLKSLIPAMGYSEKQMKELQRTINNVPCDTIVNATPVDLIKVIKLNKPVVKISYVIEERGKIKFKHILKKLI